MRLQGKEEGHDANVYNLIWFPILIIMVFAGLVVTTEAIFLTQVKKPGTVVRLIDFQEGWSSRDDGEPSVSHVRVREDSSGDSYEVTANGAFSEGDSVDISRSKQNGKLHLDVGFGEISGYLLVLTLISSVGLNLCRDTFAPAMQKVLRVDNDETKTKKVFVGTCLLASGIFFAVVIIESWGWPITYYSHFRALCTGGFVGLAFIVWGSGWFCRGLASLLSALAFAYTFLQLEKSNWYFVNLISVVAIGFAVLVTFARTPPPTAQTPTPSG